MRDDHEPPSTADPPAPEWTLTRTSWTGLHHAYGRAADAPKILVALSDADQAVRTQALDDVHGILHHQNTIYEATVPVVSLVAARPDIVAPVARPERSEVAIQFEVDMFMAAVDGLSSVPQSCHIVRSTMVNDGSPQSRCLVG